MPQPRESINDDEQLQRYLLGLLPDERAERLDEASIADDDVASRLRIVENDLVDAYVRGALAGETLERFESHYLLSPRRRQAVNFARSFVRAVDRSAPALDVSAGPHASAAGASRPDGDRTADSTWRDWLALRSRFAPAFAAAAALLVVACGALLFQTMRLRSGLNVERGERVAMEQRAHDLERQLSDRRASNDAAARELAHGAAAAVPPRPAAAESTPRASGLLATAVVLLPQTRAIGAIPVVAAPVNRAAFELRLETNDFARYQVGLKDPATNRIIWRSAWLTATPSADRQAVRVVVPASVLKPQHYSLDLSGRDDTGRTDVVGSYVFEVVPR